MNTPGMSGLETVRNATWRQNLGAPFHNRRFTANLTGIIGGIIALALLLGLPSSDVWNDSLNIRLPLYLVILVWTILNPRIVLYLLPIAVPWGSGDSFSVSSLTLYSTDILIMFLVIGWLLGFTLHATYRRKFFALPGTRSSETPMPVGTLDRAPLKIPFYLITSMLMLLGVMLLSVTVATSISDSLKEIAKWLEFTTIVLLGLQYIKTRRQIWLLITIAILAALSQAFYGYTQYFFNLGPTAFLRGNAGLRVYGSFGQPNPYAGYINIALSIALAITVLGGSWKSRTCAGIATLLLLVAEALTQSRGGEIAIGAAIILIVSLGIVQLRPLFRLAIIAVIGAIEAGLMGLLPESLFTPVLKILGLTNFSFSAPSQADFSTAERLAHWIAGLRMFWAHPILGVGIGNYPDSYPLYYVTIFVNPLGHAHNYLINIAAETGIIGLIVYLFFLISIFVASGKAYRSINRYYLALKERRKRTYPFEMPEDQITPPLTSRFALVRILRKPTTRLQHALNDRALAIGILAALVAVTTHNFVDNLYVHSITSLIALLIVSLIRLQEVTS